MNLRGSRGHIGETAGEERKKGMMEIKYSCMEFSKYF